MPKTDWLNKNIFITGCTGLLGSWVTEELCKLGANVIALIRDQVRRSRVYYAGSGQSLNFGNDTPLTGMEITEEILTLMNREDLKPLAKGEISEQYLSSGKARTTLGWKPVFTIKEGLRVTIDWYVEYFAHLAT